VYSSTEPSKEEFESQRPRLFALAYRLLGGRRRGRDAGGVPAVGQGGPAAHRLAAGLAGEGRHQPVHERVVLGQVRRQRYVGPWLPEPVLTGDGALGLLETVERRESASIALLMLLEHLTPAERGVFVLREAFGYSYREIAEVFRLSEANCRQINRRSGQSLRERRPRFAASPEQRQRLTERFLTAVGGGDLAELGRLLSDDVVAWADGGGRAPAARRPVRGADRVARYLVGTMRRTTGDVEILVAEVNGEPAVIGQIGGRVLGVMVLQITDGRISALRTVANPDKLNFLARQLSHRRPLLGSSLITARHWGDPGLPA
jgi:ketosteroid isomerase-like protein